MTYKSPRHIRAAAAVILASVCLPASAQGVFPDIYAQTPLVAAQAKTVAEWPKFTFLESILALENGEILTTDHLEGRIYSVSPAGEITTFVDIDGEILCLETAPAAMGGYFATAWEHGEPMNKGALYHITTDGAATQIASLPNEPFLNGIAQVGAGIYVMAGSGTGTIWSYDSNTGETGVWLQSEELAGPPGLPGINGIRRSGDSIYFTNTGGALIGTVAINADQTAGALTVLHQGVLLDDFAVAQDGTIYGATHIFDSILKITLSGERTLIAGPDQGVQGSTSVIWDYPGEESNTLLVPTNGGINFAMVGKTEDSVVNARVVRITLD